jgi:Methylase of chemotaxis methyl-accepting proteins
MSSLFSSTITLGKELKVTDAEFAQLRDFIYAQCGIYVADNRKYLLENRLANRLKQLNLKTSRSIITTCNMTRAAGRN